MTDLIDIEDISHPSESHAAQARAAVVVRTADGKGMTGAALVEATSSVPGTQSIWVKTFGCAHNVSDAEYMMGQLQEYGYR